MHAQGNVAPRDVHNAVSRSKDVTQHAQEASGPQDVVEGVFNPGTPFTCWTPHAPSPRRLRRRFQYLTRPSLHHVQGRLVSTALLMAPLTQRRCSLKNWLCSFPGTSFTCSKTLLTSRPTSKAIPNA
ncbi:uncharacterized protein DS421_4g118760 [Arachis hypogaea]|nr:uncharacterized protein DS421_4g118760 [Arachis hypogaea]